MTKTNFTDDDLTWLKEDLAESVRIRGAWYAPITRRDFVALLARLEAAERFVDASEMLWIVLANVSEGDWKKQNADWQEAAARWRDHWHSVSEEWRKKAGKSNIA